MNPKNLPRKQSGAVLLAFILVLIAGTSYLLLNRLNDYSTYARDTETQIALLEAKKALLSYAMNYPELRNSTEKGPGFLPCPDNHILTDPLFGNPSSNCAVSTGTTLSRLPYKILGLSDLRESGGDLLWYAVSNNYKNTQANDTVINSETPGLLSVDGSNDIVAVVIAPGSPLSGQNSRPGINKSDYLEDANADSNASTFVTSSTGEFNDRLITITREELMAVVEQRVINELRAILTDYYNDSGAYPWMTAFADPKADSRRLTGTHSGSNNSTTSLTDASSDFIDMGIKEGDVVHNITDGSLGIVDADPSTPATLTFTGLEFGSENDFDTDDIYIIYRDITGTASGSSTGLKLVDTATDFNELGITAGDIVDNTTDTGSSGMIDSVSTNEVVVTALSGGAVNSFSPGDGYRLRSNTGRATGVNNSVNLVDSGKDFTVMGVQAGDLVINLTDGSFTTVSTVATNTLTLNTLKAGTENDFDTNDYYYLPRYNTDNITREGLLSFHEIGKHFKTGFSVDWDFSAATATSSPVGLNIAYDTSLKNYTEISSGNSGEITVDSNNGYCIWADEDVADCLGVFTGINLVKGTVTSGTNTSILNDSNANFTGAGVKTGDIVENYDDEISIGVSGTATAGTTSLALEDTTKNFNTLGIIPYYHLIHNNTTSARGIITGITNANTLSVAGFDNRPAISFAAGNSYTIYAPQDVVVTNVNSSIQLNTSRLTAAAPDFDFNAGGTGGYQEFYRIKVASKKLSGTEGGGSSGSTLDGGATDFASAGVEVGDIVKNIDDGSYGTITSVSGTTLTATLYSGTDNQFNVGDTYEVYYDYVNTRQYQFRARFSNSPNIYTSGNLRKRDVCLGYNSDCSAVTGTVTLPVHTTPAVTIRDFDINNIEVSSASVTIPASTSCSVRIAGLDYYLHEANDELPEWFAKNKWHQFIYVAYSADYIPGGANDCVTNGNCLTLQVQRPSMIEVNNTREALVMVAGRQLSSQDRSDASLGILNYFENTNADNDLVFEKSDITDSFNDQISVIDP